MTGWDRDAPGRRFGVTVVVTVVLAWAGLAAGLTLLLPATGDPALLQPPLADPLVATSTCEEPQRTRTPVPARSGLVLSCPEQFDGRFVVIEGETIGDTFDGPDGRLWVQVNDDAYATAGPLSSTGRLTGTNSGLAVLLPRGHVPGELGGPGVSGDVVRVIGVFQAASPADQGGPAVIAEAVVTRRAGGHVGHAAPGRLGVAAVVGVVVTALLWVGAAGVRRRRQLA